MHYGVGGQGSWSQSSGESEIVESRDFKQLRNQKSVNDMRMDVGLGAIKHRDDRCQENGRRSKQGLQQRCHWYELI